VKIKNRPLHHQIIIGLSLLFVILLTSCDQTPTPPEATPEVAIVPSGYEVRRNVTNVWATINDPDTPETLDDSNWYEVIANGLVSTDSTGEAQLQSDACDAIYLYERSGLRLSSCSEEDLGTVGCSEEGTAVFDDCGITIQTASADLTWDTTWLSITYMGAEELTLVIVVEGRVTATPITVIENRVRGSSVTVDAGQFIYTVPDDRLQDIGGVAPRTAMPLRELPPLINALGIQNWVDDVRQRAERDGFQFPGGEDDLTPTPPPGGPDLVISSVEVSGVISVINDQIEIPLTMVVRNEGGKGADIFKVAVEYTGPRGTFVIPFTVANQENSFYPFTSAPLKPGEEVSFVGQISLDGGLLGEEVTLQAMVDSCSGEEFVPEFCRVEESEEENNESNPLNVTLEVGQGDIGRISVNFLGGVFEDTRVQQALLLSVGFEAIVESVTGDKEIAIYSVDWATGETTDLRKIAKDPEAALAILEEAGVLGAIEPIIILPEGDEEILKIGVLVRDALAGIDIFTPGISIPVQQIPNRAKSYNDGWGEIVFWIWRE
jgi:hypothetical protein